MHSYHAGLAVQDPVRHLVLHRGRQRLPAASQWAEVHTLAEDDLEYVGHIAAVAHDRLGRIPDQLRHPHQGSDGRAGHSVVQLLRARHRLWDHRLRRRRGRGLSRLCRPSVDEPRGPHRAEHRGRGRGPSRADALRHILHSTGHVDTARHQQASRRDDVEHGARGRGDHHVGPEPADFYDLGRSRHRRDDHRGDLPVQRAVPCVLSRHAQRLWRELVEHQPHSEGRLPGGPDRRLGRDADHPDEPLGERREFVHVGAGHLVRHVLLDQGSGGAALVLRGRGRRDVRHLAEAELPEPGLHRHRVRRNAACHRRSTDRHRRRQDASRQDARPDSAERHLHRGGVDGGDVHHCHIAVGRAGHRLLQGLPDGRSRDLRRPYQRHAVQEYRDQLEQHLPQL
mmetsp:Transcript_14453/g.41548  ORF Transcript_14453/g.41548 Transcript_14453/m.41548 type:complete len:396 (-) Transcript_14453:773-1960(-)